MANNDQEHAIAIKQGGGLRNKVMLAILVLISAGGVLFFWWGGKLDTSAREILASARQEATALQSQRPVIKPADNAAGPFTAACKKYVEPADETLDESSKDAGRDFTSAAVKKFLASNAGCLADLEQALQLPACDYGGDYSKGLVGQELPPMIEIRKAKRLLVIAARHDAVEGKTGPALKKLALLLRVADPVSCQPALIPRMMRCATEISFAEGLAGLLGDSEPTMAELAGLLRALSKHTDARDDMSAAYRLEKALLGVSIGRALTGETPLRNVFSTADGMALRTWWWRHRGNFIKDLEMMNTAQEQVIQAASQPYPQALDAIRKQAAEFGTPPDWALMCRVALANSQNSSESDCESLAQLRLARLLVGLRLHRMAQGAYPTGLDKIESTIGSVPFDPFTGDPFGYKKTPKGCKVWSIGRNRKDDAGDPKKDLVFELKQ
jgi:hypothetical protein